MGRPGGCELFAIVRPESSVPANVTPVFWDMRGPLPLNDLPSSVGAIVHLASERDRGDDSVDSLSRHIRLTLDATARLYSWAYRSGVTKILHLSSISVYQTGANPTDLLNEESALVTPPAPPYGLTKRWSDELACEFRPHLESIHIVRPAQVYGPDQKETGVLGRIARQLRRGRSFTLAAPHGHFVNPVFIDDLLYVLVRLLDTPSHETVCVAGPDTLSERQQIEDIARLIGSEAVIDLDRDERPETFAFATTKLDRLMPSRPQTSWAEGLARTADALLRQAGRDTPGSTS